MASSPPTKNKKRTQAWYRRRCVDRAKRLCRDIGYCEYCGAKRGTVQLQASHVFPEEYHPVCTEPRNLVCLCARCHKFGNNAWHKGPQIPVWFFRTRHKDYVWLEIMKDGPEPDWKEEYEKTKSAPD